MSRILHQQISFADLEWQRLGIPFDPTLQAVADFLDRQQRLVEEVRKDLERGLKNPRAGREGMPPSQVLRSLVLMRIKNWDYRELRERIDDGLSLRSFTQFDSRPVPKHDAFNGLFAGSRRRPCRKSTSR
jgi:IS5 family transposase